MRRRPLQRYRRSRRRQPEQEEQGGAGGRKTKPGDTRGAHYRAGSMLALPGGNTPAGPRGRERGEEGRAAQNQQARSLAGSLQSAPNPELQVSGRGTPSQDSARASTVRLEGRTDADFDGGSFATQNVRVSAAEGCESCAEGDPCIRARGTLVARYHVTTTVTLPAASDFPDLTPCQRARVQDAIDNILAPHEQEHVRAFQRYNGVVRTPFDVTLCRSQFDSTIQDMFDRQESSRRDAAQDASDALDPFHFDVDIDCEEPPEDESAVDDEAEGGNSDVAEADNAETDSAGRPEAEGTAAEAPVGETYR